MAHELNPLSSLQAALRQAFKCDVRHSQTVPVHETMDGRTLWRGDVEVFDLMGHPEAKKCYAWLRDEPGKSPRFVAVLGKKHVTSPELAVRSAIFFDVQPPSFPRPDPPA